VSGANQASVQVSITFSMCSWQVSGVTILSLILSMPKPFCIAGAKAATVKYKENEGRL